MSSNPSAFARRVLAAFADAGLATDEEVGDAGGPSTTTLAKYRKVAAGEMSMAEPRGDVLKRIDRAAGWKGGSARALWRDGKDPVAGRPGPSLAQALGVQGATSRSIRTDSIDGYVVWLAERLTEVEERLDLLEQGATSATDTDVSAADDELPAAAKKGNLEQPGEFNT